MAATNTLQKTLNLASIFVGGAPLSAIIGVANEPALSIGDWVRQFILAPPFAWSWNRATTTITVTSPTQDYVKVLTDFGWMEKATWDDSSNPVRELEIVLNLPETREQEEVRQIAARIDDNTNNITFRIFPAPPLNATITVTYQKLAPSFSALSGLWAPIPDHLYYLCQQGFLAKTLEYRSDPRYIPAMQLFLQQVIAANAALTETQVNLFLAGFLNTQREINRTNAPSARG